MRNYKFYVFRYQLLPVSNTIQLTMYSKHTGHEDLLLRKNDFMATILKKDNLNPRIGHSSTVVKPIYNEGNEFMFRIGAKRQRHIRTVDFDEVIQPDYPNLIVYIDNDPSKQYILIQENREAFSEIGVVPKGLENYFNRLLKEYDLSIYIKKKFEPAEFWGTLKKFENEITAIYFELIQPNMANISGKIKSSLKIIQSGTNSHEIDMTLRAPQGQVLENLNQENEALTDITEYASEGGGEPPQISIKNLRGKRSTVEHQEVIDFSADEITGSPEEVAKIVRELKKFLK